MVAVKPFANAVPPDFFSEDAHSEARSAYFWTSRVSRFTTQSRRRNSAKPSVPQRANCEHERRSGFRSPTMKTNAVLRSIPIALLLLAVPHVVFAATLIHVRVIDGTGQPPIEDATVVIENGTIASIGKET